MPSASTTLSTSVLKKAIERYYKQLQDYKGRAEVIAVSEDGRLDERDG
jgi:hypothetical protein